MIITPKLKISALTEINPLSTYSGDMYPLHCNRRIYTYGHAWNELKRKLLPHCEKATTSSIPNYKKF